ncbi:MAG TPA: ATP-dependent 6-phosphofructokinase [Phycisphaerales bacterium]|nr:ATP-dependent 6-phosphofructokinase [Phycisphaerales bacterium]
MPSTTKPLRTIGILTGGGDCPGLNAVIRAVTKSAIHDHNLRVIGIRDGFAGLIEDRTCELTFHEVSGILARGGTILGTNNRCNPERYCISTDAQGNPVFSDATSQCLATIQKHNMDALVLLGGDGTMSCARSLIAAGVPCIGVPKTIDNDVVGTDLSFGFTTAVSTATACLDNLQSTADSHHRVMVCELMGRNAGWLALHAGVASGADVILIPEIPFELEAVADLVRVRQQRGPGFSIIVCAEGAAPVGQAKTVMKIDPKRADPFRLGGIGRAVAESIELATGLETRHTVLGHIVRGGSPVASDRVLATLMGCRAVEMLREGFTHHLIGLQGTSLVPVDLSEVIHRQRLVPLDHALIAAARSVRTSFGTSELA